MKVIIVSLDLQEAGKLPSPEPDHGGDRLVQFIRRFLLAAQKFFSASKWLANAVWGRAKSFTRWLSREFCEPTLCFCSVYLGVVSTILLPSALVPNLAGIVLSPLAALPVAVIVVDTRAHRRWKASDRVTLGMRLLRACSDGILWWCWWRKL